MTVFGFKDAGWLLRDRSHLDAYPHITGTMKQLLLPALLVLCPAASALAGSCLSYEAAYTIESRIEQGMTWHDALQSVIDEDYSDGSNRCLRSIKQEIQQTPYAFPHAHQALYKRSRR